MITVTLNPAVDRALEVSGFQVGQHARARRVGLLPAGKGINVARGLARLGGEAIACGFVGRGEQRLYRDSLERDGVCYALSPVAGVTRTNITILDPQRGTTTHLREEGFSVSDEDVKALRSDLEQRLQQADGGDVAFCGSLPPGITPRDFCALLRACDRAGGRVAVDTSGEAFRAAIESGAVHTIKPNLAELGQCLKSEISADEAPEQARRLLDTVECVLLTLGESGAWVVRAEGEIGMHCRTGEAPARNTVGCGDAFLAGWFYGLGQSGEVQEALRWAVASGAASALAASTVGYSREDVFSLRARCERM